MKFKNSTSILLTAVGSMLVVSSCGPEIYNEPPKFVNLPDGLAEKIAKYEAIKEYTEITMGVSIDFDLYMGDETYAAIVNENFDEATVFSGMSIGEGGAVDYAKADPLVAKLKAAGLSVYGQTLVWDTPEIAAYFNSVLGAAPKGPNLVTNGDFETGDMTGWTAKNPNPANNPDNITIQAAAKKSGNYGLQAISTDVSDSEWKLQFNTQTSTVIPGKAYMLEFDVRSDKAGSARLSFIGGIVTSDNPANQYPGLDWYGTGTVAGSFATSSAWSHVAVLVTPATDVLNIDFDFGKLPSVTYFIDNVEVYDPDPYASVLVNGDFETGDNTSWVFKNGTTGISVDASAAHAGDWGLKATSADNSDSAWKLQFNTTAENLDNTKIYTLSFWIRADKNAPDACRLSFPGDFVKTSLDGTPNQYPSMNLDPAGDYASYFSVGTDWKKISFDYVPVNTSISIDFDFGLLPGMTYFIDDVALGEKAPEGSGDGEEMTVEQMRDKLEPELQKYIADAVAYFADDVDVWEVVKEPFNDDGTANVAPAENEESFNFGYYYGGTGYVSIAFEAAREANPDAVLFINESRLETVSTAKLDAIVELAAGVGDIDGIGTAMRFSLGDYGTTVTNASIDNMFVKLAATGKLIKITELGITVDSAPGRTSPLIMSEGQQKLQAELYHRIVMSYRANVPASQQYGIAIGAVSDKASEHSGWFPYDAPYVLDLQHQRKWSYKALADGLAGVAL